MVDLYHCVKKWFFVKRVVADEVHNDTVLGRIKKTDPEDHKVILTLQNVVTL